MFDCQIRKEKTGNPEKVIHPVKSRKMVGGGGGGNQGKQETQNKIVEINSNTKEGKMIVNVQEDNLNVNAALFLVIRQTKYPRMAPKYLAKHFCSNPHTRLYLALNFTGFFGL